MRALTRLRIHLPALVVWASLAACGDEAARGPSAAPSEAKSVATEAGGDAAGADRPLTPPVAARSEPTFDDEAAPPLDFPVAMPAARSVTLSHHAKNEDGTDAYTLNYEAEAGAEEIDAVAATVQASFEAEGLEVVRSEFRGPEGTMITLKARTKGASPEQSGAVAATATLSTTEHDPELRVVAGWRGPTRN